MPELRNFIDHETIHGYRTFELWQGDITEPGFPVNVLAVSAFAGNYRPTRTSVIGALHRRCKINVGELVKNCEYDLREALGVWISQPLLDAPFQRILGVELLGSSLDPVEVLDNLFAALALFEAKGITVRTLALPLLGAGDQNLDPEMIMNALLPAAKRAVERSTTLERVAFFSYTPETAELLDEAMNEALGRTHILLPKGPLIKDLCSDIVASLKAQQHLVDERHRPLLDDLEDVLRREEIRSFEIGILGRRFAEMLVADFLDDPPSTILARNIGTLRRTGIAEWMGSYLHVLRHLGNESAHERRLADRSPAFVSEGDLVIGLFCIQRLWDFWVEWKVNQPSSPDLS